MYFKKLAKQTFVKKIFRTITNVAYLTVGQCIETNQTANKQRNTKKKNQNKKIQSLIEKPHQIDVKCLHIFYKRVVNNPDIQFSDKDIIY